MITEPRKYYALITTVYIKRSMYLTWILLTEQIETAGNGMLETWCEVVSTDM